MPSTFTGREPLTRQESYQIIYGQTATYFDNNYGRGNNGETHRNILSCVIYDKFKPIGIEQEEEIVRGYRECGSTTRREIRILGRLAFGEPNYERIQQYWKGEVPIIVKERKANVSIDLMDEYIEYSQKLLQQYEECRNKIVESGLSQQQANEILKESDEYANKLLGVKLKLDSMPLIADGLIDDVTGNMSPQYPGHTINVNNLASYIPQQQDPMSKYLASQIPYLLQSKSGENIDMGHQMYEIFVKNYMVPKEYFEEIDREDAPPVLSYNQYKNIIADVIELSRNLIKKYVENVLYLFTATKMNQDITYMINVNNITLIIQSIWETTQKLKTPEEISKMYMESTTDRLLRPEQYIK